MPSSVVAGEDGGRALTKRFIAEREFQATAFELEGVLSSAEAAHFVACSEALGFDNAHHPNYQNQEIDRAEEQYRQNDRAVYHASEEEVQWLFERLRPHLAPEIATAQCTWGLWGLNDMWRLYRYNASRTRFPPHFDNCTAKTDSLLSFMSVLVYLTDDFKGGGTQFFDTSRGPPATVIGGVKPKVGSVVVFRHLGRNSPLHEGQAYEGGREPKYVLRTDVMYQALDRCGRAFLDMVGRTGLSPPYDKIPYVYPASKVEQVLELSVSAVALLGGANSRERLLAALRQLLSDGWARDEAVAAAARCM